MDTQETKLKLIEWILQIRDVQLLRQLEEMSSQDEDWWNNLPESVKGSIERGIAQADAGKLKSHEAVMKKYQ